MIDDVDDDDAANDELLIAEVLHMMRVRGGYLTLRADRLVNGITYPAGRYFLSHSDPMENLAIADAFLRADGVDT